MAKKAKVYDSMKQAAAGLNRPLVVVQAAKRAGCPAFRGSRVHCDELTRWLDEHPDIARMSGPAHDLDAKGRLEEARAKWQELKNAEKERQLVPKAWVADRLRRIASRVTGYRARSISEHPSRIPDGSLAGKRVALEEIWDEIMRALQECSAEFAETPKAKRGKR